MKKVTFLCLALLTPIIAFAQFTQTKSYIASIGSIVQMLTVIVMGLALLYFFWGLAKFILAAGDEKKIAEGKSIMIWGIIALFVMASVWGLVGLLGQELGIRQGGTFDFDSPSGASSGGGTNGAPFDPEWRYDCGNPGQGECL